MSGGATGIDAVSPPWRSIRVLLPTLLLISFLLRVWFASGGLDYRRFFDERYSLDNVAELLDGRFQPVWGWYPSLSYLPQTALLAPVEWLHEATGIEVLRVRTGERFTPMAILLCRILGCVYGTLGIWLVYRIGRRVFDPEVGLTAAFLFSVLPDQVRLSAYIKPDSLMILTLLLAFLATLEVWKRPSWRNYLLAGAALGLVVSSKPYGGVGALPLVAVAGLHARSEPRQLLRLAAAGLAALGLFVALNPFLGVLAEFAARNQSIYEGRGEGRLAALRATFAAPMRLHGVVVGWAAVAGLAGLAWRSRSLSSPPAMRVPSGLIVLFVVAYALVSALLFGWVKANLWLPLAPFTALAAAFALVGAGRRLPWRGGRVLASAAGAALALALAWGLLHWVYLVRVPTTWTAASDYLAFRLPPPLSGRLIWVETPPGEFLPAVRAWTKGHATPLPVADLAAVAPQRLDRADAELFPRRRLEEDGGFYRGRLERFAASAPLVVEPRLLRVRGPALQIVFHPWARLAGDLRLDLQPSTDDPRRLVADLPGRPAARPNFFASVQVERPVRGGEEPRLRLAGRGVELFRVRDTESGDLWVSDRFRMARSGRRLELSPGGGRPGEMPELFALYWEYRVQPRDRS